MNVFIVNCFDTYEHRVDLLHDVLVEEGHKVKVLSSNYRHFDKIKRNEPKEDFVFFDASPYRKNLSYRRLHSHIKLSKDIFSYLESDFKGIDLLWILVPPNSFVKDARRFKDEHRNVKLIFDLIDLWPETMPIGSVKNMFPFSIWKNLRDINIRCADVVVTECNLYQKKLKTILNGIKTETLYLARPLITYEPHLRIPNDRINLCYLGSINNIIDIEIIGQVIAEIRKQKTVELHIIGDGERKDELIETSEKAGAKVFFYGKVYDRDEKQKIFDSCHYGLNIMKDSVCVGLTMKSMDYMEFGLPMINNIHGDTWDIIEEYKFGVNIGKVAHLKVTNYDMEARFKVRQFFLSHLTLDVFTEGLRRIMKDI